MVIAFKSNPETAPKYADELHKWYAQNKQQAILFGVRGVFRGIILHPFRCLSSLSLSKGEDPPDPTFVCN